MVDDDAVPPRGFDHDAFEAKDRHGAQVIGSRPQVSKPFVVLQLGKAVGPDGESNLPVALRSRQSDTQIVDERRAAITGRSRDLFGLIDADENCRVWTARRTSKLLALLLKEDFDRCQPRRRKGQPLIALGLRPSGKQAITNIALRFD